MKVSELFANLSAGELSNTAAGNDGAGTIRNSDQARVIRHTNEGLLRLYSRFSLLEKTVLVETRAAKTLYPLSSKFSLTTYATNPGQIKPYIVDSTADPFIDDVIKILDVYDSLQRKLALNDEENRNSVFTPQPTVLQVPRPVPGVCLGVKYQAKHPVVTTNLEDEIILPDTLQGALYSFIGWKFYANMNTQEAAANAQAHQANFEAICSEAVMTDTVNSSISSTNTKFERRGWR